MTNLLSAYVKQLKNMLMLVAALIFSVSLFFPASASAADITAPTLDALVLQPQRVNTSTSFAEVVIQAKITESESGFDGGGITWTAPGGGQTFSVDFAQGACDEFVMNAIVPQGAVNGVWKASAILFDNAGNVRNYSNVALTNAGIDADISVVGSAADNQAPKLNSFSLSTTTMSRSNSEPYVYAFAKVIEDQSGVDKGIVRYTSPSGSQTIESELAHSCGVFEHFETTLTVPPNAQVGAWRPTVILMDNAGNTRTITANLPNLDITN